MGIVRDIGQISIPASYTVDAKSVVLVKWCAIIAAILYIIESKVLGEGKYLTPHGVSGIAHFTLQNPAAKLNNRTEYCSPLDSMPKVDGHNSNPFVCVANWTAKYDLPYCVDYTGKGEAPPQLSCIYRDSFSMYPRTQAPGSIFVPTYMKTYVPKHNCEPTEKNNFFCETMWDIESVEEYFIADIENFVIMLDHSYSVLMSSGTLKKGDRGGENSGKLAIGEEQDVSEAFGHMFSKHTEHEDTKEQEKKSTGRLLSAEDLQPGIAAMGKKAAGTLQSSLGGIKTYQIPDNGDANLEDYPSVVRNNLGDRFAVRDLVKLADPERNYTAFDMPRDNKLSTLRRDGGHIVMSVHYTNKATKGGVVYKKDISDYQISAGFSRLKEYKQVYNVESYDGEQRKLVDVHGLLISVEVVGHIYSPDFLAVGTVVAVVMTSLYTFINVIDKELAKQFGSVMRQQQSQQSEHSADDMTAMVSCNKWQKVSVRDMCGEIKTFFAPLKNREAEPGSVTTKPEPKGRYQKLPEESERV